MHANGLAFCDPDQVAGCMPAGLLFAIPSKLPHASRLAFCDPELLACRLSWKASVAGDMAAKNIVK